MVHCVESDVVTVTDTYTRCKQSAKNCPYICHARVCVKLTKCVTTLLPLISLIILL